MAADLSDPLTVFLTKAPSTLWAEVQALLARVIAEHDARVTSRLSGARPPAPGGAPPPSPRAGAADAV